MHSYQGERAVALVLVPKLAQPRHLSEQTWTTLRIDGPDHLGVWHMAQITSHSSGPSACPARTSAWPRGSPAQSAGSRESANTHDLL